MSSGGFQGPVPLGEIDLYRVIGRGGMATVWSGIHRASATPVAVKTIVADKADTSDYGVRMRDEARAMAALRHPNVMMVLDLGEVEHDAETATGGEIVAGTPYLVMELATGGSLDQYARPDSSALPWPAVRETLVQLLDALAHAHARGWIHRDIKPENALISGPSDVRPGVKLTDFGLAHRPTDDNAEPITTEHAIGTARFMPPEQIRGKLRDYGPWTDLYSLGCLAFQMVCGTPAYLGESRFELMLAHVNGERSEYRPRVLAPPGFEGWIDAMVRPQPADRIQSAVEAAQALLALEPAATPGTLPGLWFTQDDDSDWRRPTPMPSDAPLLLAGAGLFGLRAPRVVAREPERDRLWGALRRCRDEGRVQIVLIEGDPGFGKTRLAQWLCQRAVETGSARAIEATHSPIPARVDGVPAMLLRALGCQRLPRDKAVGRLAKVLPTYGIDEQDEIRAFCDYLAPALHDPAAPRAVPGIGEHPRLVARLLTAMSDERPLIVRLDDASDDLATLGLVESLTQPGSPLEAPVLLLMTSGKGENATQKHAAHLMSTLEERPHFERITLAPLTSSQVELMLDASLPLDPGVASQLAAHAGGSPLLASQILGDWLERGLLQVGADRFELAAGGGSTPEIFREAAWTSRLERALGGRSEDQRLGLELAAALGQEVDDEEWRAACAFAGVGVPTELLSDLLDRRLAVCGPSGSAHGWWFAHANLRQSVMAGAARQGAAPERHRACAAVLTERGGPRAYERAAGHLEAAGELESASEHLLTALQRRVAQGEPWAAEALLERWRWLADRMKLPASDPRRGEAGLLAAELHIIRGAWDEAVGEAEGTLVKALAFGWDAVELQVLRLAGHALAEVGRADDAEKRLVQGEVLALAQGEPLLRVRYLVHLGDLRRMQGRHEDAHGLYLEALSGAAAVDEYVGHCTYGMACLAGRAGRYDDAKQWAEKTQAAWSRSGNRSGLAKLLNELGEIERRAGKLDAAETAYRDAARLLDVVGHSGGTVARTNVALVLVLRGRYDEARPVLEACLAAAERERWGGMLGVLNLVLLPCMAADRDWVGWQRHLSAGLAGLGQAGYADPDTAAMTRLAGEIAHAAGALERAQEAYAVAIQQLTTLGRTEEAEEIRQTLLGLG